MWKEACLGHFFPWFSNSNNLFHMNPNSCSDRFLFNSARPCLSTDRLSLTFADNSIHLYLPSLFSMIPLIWSFPRPLTRSLFNVNVAFPVVSYRPGSLQWLLWLWILFSATDILPTSTSFFYYLICNIRSLE